MGVGESRRAIRQGIARVVVIAGDASAGQRAKVEGVARARDVPVLTQASSARLGEALGRGPVTAVAVTDAGLAAGLLDGAGRRSERAVPGKARGRSKKRLVRRSRAECG